MIKRYVPVTPAGSVMFDLEADTEEEARANLLESVGHTKDYTIEEYEDVEDVCGNCGGMSPDCWICNPHLLDGPK